MSSATRSICCACLFMAVFFDAGQTKKGKRDLMSFAHGTKSLFKANVSPFAKKYGGYINIQNKKKLDNIYFGMDDSVDFITEYQSDTENATATFTNIDKTENKDGDRIKYESALDDENWPKFDDIMRMTNKYYDWKNDRWRKYREQKDNRNFENGRIGNNITNRLNQNYKSNGEIKKIDLNRRKTSKKKTPGGGRLNYDNETRVSNNLSGAETDKGIMKKFHFTRVRMNDTSHSRNIVVAVSVTSPKKKKVTADTLKEAKRSDGNKNF